MANIRGVLGLRVLTLLTHVLKSSYAHGVVFNSREDQQFGMPRLLTVAKDVVNPIIKQYKYKPTISG